MTSILVKDGIIVTMDPSHRILSDHSIIVSRDPNAIDAYTVLLDGNVIMKERRVLTVEEERVQSEAQNAAAGLWERLKTAKPQVEHVGTTSLMPR